MTRSAQNWQHGAVAVRMHVSRCWILKASEEYRQLKTEICAPPRPLSARSMMAKSYSRLHLLATVAGAIRR
jgi:hypothetical protein